MESKESDFIKIMTTILDERSQRIMLGAYANCLGHGGVTALIVAATIFWRKNAQIDWHKTAINDVTNFFKQRKHALCEKYYGAVFALIENFLTGNWAA